MRIVIESWKQRIPLPNKAEQTIPAKKGRGLKYNRAQEKAQMRKEALDGTQCQECITEV